MRGISEYCSHFCLHSPQTASQFCKTSATSLVALYHKGALPCECHPAGAIGQHCSPNGGQCPCRPGVTGQKCSRCQVGYFGFPHCKRECTFRSCESVWALLTQVFSNVPVLSCTKAPVKMWVLIQGARWAESLQPASVHCWLRGCTLNHKVLGGEIGAFSLSL